MIETLTYSLELSSHTLEKIPSESGLDINQLILESNELSQLVSYIQLNFQEPDYFGLKGNFSDLLGLLKKVTFVFRSYQSDLNPFGNENEMENSYYWKKKELIFTDKEMIFKIVSELGELIQSYRKAAMEAGKAESFLIKGSLENLLIELEKSLWIFTLFSKY